MGINKQWESSLAFRNFRDKTHDLSRVYWTQQMGADSLLGQLNGKNPNDISAKVINCSFDSKMHNQTVADTISWLSTYMERNRLHLLVIYTAFLETYLKEITFYHAASTGHVSNINEISEPLKLTAVGAAMTQPIIRSSTVPEMIKYAAEYYDINFGVAAIDWIKIYKVRCAAAHNGGIATPKFLKEIINQLKTQWANPKKAIHNNEETIQELACDFSDEIADFSAGYPVDIPEDLKDFWLISNEANLFFDVKYGQWGLHIMSPQDAIIATEVEKNERPDEYENQEIIIGSFFGDSDKLVINCSPEKSGRIIISQPIDERKDWPIIANSFTEFMN